MQTTYVIVSALIVLVVAAVGAGVYFYGQTGIGSGSSTKIQIVAAENFWGELVSQLGGTHVQVLSIVTDPNTDPHEYASSAVAAKAIASASLVIVNGAGYDTWALRLIAAGNTHSGQKVLNIADLLGKKQGDNPHFWYSAVYVNETVHAMYSNLVSIDPGNSAYYHQRYASLNASLFTYMSREAIIKSQFSGTNVASTESIFEYMADDTGLHIVSPPEFMKAVAEGNDPAAQDVATFQSQLAMNNGTYVRVLIYNAQTVTPLTQNVKAQAAQYGIPTVAVTETIQPPDVSFQAWMNAEVIALQNALNAQALGK